VVLSLRREEDDLVVDPWPFGRGEIRCRIGCRVVDARMWGDAGALDRALETAPVRILEVGVRGSAASV
jgi:hypothetical protein